MSKLHFRFDFCLDNEDDTEEESRNKSYRFELSLPNNITPDEFFGEETDEAIELTENIQNELNERDLERVFGIHDVNGSNDLNGNIEWGYCTYEVEESKIPELLNVWKEIWNKFDVVTGEIEEIQE